MSSKGSSGPLPHEILIEEARLAHDKDKSSEKVLPSTTKMAYNLAKAVTKHVAGGLRRVDVTTYTDRLQICNPCELRLKNRCTHEDCGCFLDKKAWWESEQCPIDKWDKFGV